MNIYTVDIHAYPDVSCGVLFFAEVCDFYTRIYMRNAPQRDPQNRADVSC